MVHPDTELRFVSPAIGWGVFATRDIPTGTITWALDVLDQHFPMRTFADCQIMPGSSSRNTPTSTAAVTTFCAGTTPASTITRVMRIAWVSATTFRWRCATSQPERS